MEKSQGEGERVETSVKWLLINLEQVCDVDGNSLGTSQFSSRWPPLPCDVPLSRASPCGLSL